MTPPRRGLSSAEAAARLASEGYNELRQAGNRSLLTIAWEVVREPMFLLLIVGGAIYLILGDVHEALVLLSSVLVILVITIFQARRTERALTALRDLSSPRALVVRDGERRRIPGREVVRGDLLVLEEGDRVPADAVLWEVSDLRVDESLLTGESVAVDKSPWDGRQQLAQPGGEGLPFVFSGTLVVQGHAIAETLATGASSQLGRIGEALHAIKKDRSPLQIETAQVVRLFATIGLVFCLLVVLLYGLTRGPWLDGVLAGITLAMATLPEEFPVVLTVFMALGAWRISRQRVLTRQMPAIETLGAATVLCVDKTGTLTLNRMALQRVVADQEQADLRARDQPLEGRLRDVLSHAVWASEVEPFDPMERALQEAAEKFSVDSIAARAGMRLEREYPLSPQLLVHTHAWRGAGGEGVVSAKGAPEAVARVCRLSEAQWSMVRAQVDALAARGLRVLGVACARHSSDGWPDSQMDFQFEFLGLVALADPVRPTVQGALAQCSGAGIRVVMITGDYPITASAIGAEIGLRQSDRVITGADMADLDDERLRALVHDVNVFARVSPTQKLRLVQALKANGEVVAMTGDGVNDAPALKAAHIGIAMGGRGTDVARESASLVLLDDDFASIVTAVRLGRRIYDNIGNAMRYIVAVHIPTAGMSLLPIVFGWPLMFFPVHIVFLEFVIDPACSIAFEADPERDDVMRRPPRSVQGRLFSLRVIGICLLQGLGLLLTVAVLYAVALHRGLGEETARAMAFAAIVLGNLGLILVNRSERQSTWSTLRLRNAALGWLAGGTLVALALSLYVPAVRDLFRFAPLSVTQWFMALVAALGGLSLFELYKWTSTPRQAEPR